MDYEFHVGDYVETVDGEIGYLTKIVIDEDFINFYGVFSGTAMAQLLLVATSMLVGRSVSKCFTNKQISILGGVVFLMFAFIYLVDKLFYIDFV